jgi:hypothetical protein
MPYYRKKELNNTIIFNYLLKWIIKKEWNKFKWLEEII